MATKIAKSRKFPFPSEQAYAKKTADLLRRFKWFTLFDGAHADATGEFIFCDMWKCLKQEGAWKCYRRSLDTFNWEPIHAQEMPNFFLWPIRRATSKGVMWGMIGVLQDRLFRHVSSQFKEGDWDENNGWKGNLARKAIRKRLVQTIIQQGGGEIACKKMTSCLWEVLLDKEKSGLLIAIHGNQRGFSLPDILDLHQNEEAARQWKKELPNAMPLLSRMGGSWVMPKQAPHWLMKASAVHPAIKTVKLAKEILAAPYSLLSAVAQTGSVKYWHLSNDVRSQLEVLRVRDRATVAYKISSLAVRQNEYPLLDRLVDFYCKTQYLLPDLPNRTGFAVYSNRFAPVQETWSSMLPLLKGPSRKENLAKLLEGDAWMKCVHPQFSAWLPVLARYNADQQAKEMQKQAIEVVTASEPAIPVGRRRL